ncbi:hypothetical protein EVAR_3183_1 [Eumeta japonica]|uniref:Uncharacterized protein n=1 Tax=Eumeta variegata TaxID=151549 RepID=A0A4C1XEX5_EUMVA|nr:hypothetical protein EVAR_3183_1 [Eumeta japonica]
MFEGTLSNNNIHLELHISGENRTRLRCDGVKRRARIAAHGRYFLTKRTIGTADGRQWPAFREIFAQPKRGRVRHDTRRSLKIIVSLVSLTYAQRVHRGRTTIFLPSEDIECCKVLDLFAEDRLTRRRVCCVWKWLKQNAKFTYLNPDV